MGSNLDSFLSLSNHPWCTWQNLFNLLPLLRPASFFISLGLLNNPIDPDQKPSLWPTYTTTQTLPLELPWCRIQTLYPSTNTILILSSVVIVLFHGPLPAAWIPANPLLIHSLHIITWCSCHFLHLEHLFCVIQSNLSQVSSWMILKLFLWPSPFTNTPTEICQH